MQYSNIGMDRANDLYVLDTGILKPHFKVLFSKCSIFLNFLIFLLYRIALFMYDYYTDRLSWAFSDFFEKVNNRHNYNTRLAAKESYSLPLVRTKYGQFSLRFIGVKVWNSLNENYKLLSRRSFKKTIQSDFVILYWCQSYLFSPICVFFSFL